MHLHLIQMHLHFHLIHTLRICIWFRYCAIASSLAFAFAFTCARLSTSLPIIYVFFPIFRAIGVTWMFIRTVDLNEKYGFTLVSCCLSCPDCVNDILHVSYVKCCRIVYFDLSRLSERCFTRITCGMFNTCIGLCVFLSCLLNYPNWANNSFNMHHTWKVNT